ncbi:MAG: hypothetical protein LC793_11540 [Thermomicrobia bacterium]|nr:hypothetical protein [Thermomicrobia bacterium]
MGDSEIVDDAETQRRPHMLLGRYQIERIMGGGLATVFIVRDTQFARRAALKTIRAVYVTIEPVTLCSHNE